MHQELIAFFAEHETPTHASKRDVHGAQQAILGMAARAQQQVATYRGLLIAAEMAEHDHAVDGKLEMLHQTLGAMETAAAEFVRAGRALAQCFTQYDRYATEGKIDLETREAAMAAGPVPNGE